MGSRGVVRPVGTNSETTPVPAAAVPKAQTVASAESAAEPAAAGAAEPATNGDSSADEAEADVSAVIVIEAAP